MNEYYGERHGLVNKNKYDLRDLRDLFVLFHDNLRKDGYLIKFYGGKDNWGGFHSGICGDNMDVFCFSKTGYKGLLPVDYGVRYKEAQIFTLIEMFYTYVNDNDPFSDGDGKIEYRKRINKILNSYGEGWELTDEGYVRELVDNGLSSLLAQKYDDSDIYTDISEAKQEFLKYGATLDDKKDALIRLGNIMEPLRDEMKASLSKADTSDIFNLLNNFQLRHNNAKQKTDYDKEIYYPWMFYQMLAALDAFLKIKERGQ
ncbi:hypothetical protein BK739_07240 [Bacillus thuringiensis serovar pirenaica]|uniref:hypothetical protein n=1 Tax=Bacillus cereus group TaxID=86661 RepID=UPI000A38E325|nr:MULTISPECIES: hypothetical protein [Bacillus cereus group]MCU5635365.1 hypothetical protein [Bacillus cereus]OUB32220.1 hypothetical protein BK739_07240 [Bacillus thuringiensis serovar pirenaica]